MAASPRKPAREKVTITPTTLTAMTSRQKTRTAGRLALRNVAIDNGRMRLSISAMSFGLEASAF
jgi:hypothetical protein